MAKWWLDGRERQKIVICKALDTPVVAKFQLQLPSVSPQSQFSDLRLYLLYCVKHGAIKTLI